MSKILQSCGMQGLEKLKKRTLVERIHEQKKLIENQENALESREKIIGSLESRLEELEKTHTVLKRSHEEIAQRHFSQSEKFMLLSKSLSLEPESNQDFEEFSRLLTEEYMAFAAEESSLADEAQAVLELYSILDALRLVVNVPHVAGKTILAIAGGFSSGKSAFINSFMEDTDIKLSMGINPVTIVPSYVVCSRKSCIKIHGPNGGNAELDKEIYRRMSHEYVQGFGFDLRKILPFISVTVPLKQEFFQSICIVDTPGYNPGVGASILSGDKNSAAKLVGQASAMIWMIPIDAGTIPQTDLEFLEESGISGDKLYIVLNKADLKAQEDIDIIMEQVAEDLAFYGIEYAGICAYSSLFKDRDYGYRGKSLAEFFKDINRQSDIYSQFSQRIAHVFEQYNKALDTDKNALLERKSTLRKIELFTLKHGGTELHGQFQENFGNIDLEPDIRKIDSLVEKARDIHARLEHSLKKLISGLGISLYADGQAKWCKGGKKKIIKVRKTIKEKI